jgi:GAF domain-containing protein
MKKAPVPQNEKERMEAVHELAILDTDPEERFDNLTKEAKKKLKVPMSTVTILDSDREWFKSFEGLDEREGDREVSFCGHALLANDIFVVEDTLKDERFFDNPMVIGKPFVRFYAGIALFNRRHRNPMPVGVFCIKDTKPRKFDVEEMSILIDLAIRAERELNK